MKKFIVTALIASSLAAPVALFAASQKDTSVQKDYLFIQTARQGSLETVNKQQGIYKLTLKNTSHYVEYFTDRPLRITGMMPITQYLQEWQKDFSKIPPNAGIDAVNVHVVTQKHVKPLHIVMELSNPSYNAKQRSFTYTAHALQGGSNLPEKLKFKDVAVFIDQFCASCIGGGY